MEQHNNQYLAGMILAFFAMFMLRASPAAADTCGGDVQCHCGDTIIASSAMWYDLSCPDTTLSVQGENITIDCQGHTFRAQTARPESSNAIEASSSVKGTTGILIGPGAEGTMITGCSFRGYDKTVEVRDTRNVTIITRNEFSGDGQIGLRIGQGIDNTIWDNRFLMDDGAYEEPDGHKENTWHKDDIGNFWNDFRQNEGFPWRYVIPPGKGGVDEHPAEECVDKDEDQYSAMLNKNCPHNPQLDCDDSDPSVNPGAAEVCANGKDDDCDGQVDEDCKAAFTDDSTGQFGRNP